MRDSAGELNSIWSDAKASLASELQIPLKQVGHVIIQCWGRGGVDNSILNITSHQGVIDFTGTETFAKKLE